MSKSSATGECVGQPRMASAAVAASAIAHGTISDHRLLFGSPTNDSEAAIATGKNGERRRRNAGTNVSRQK